MEGGIKRIKAFIERVKAMDGLTLDNIGKALADFRDNVLSYFLNFGGIFDGLIQAVKDFGAKSGNPAPKGLDPRLDVGEGFLDALCQEIMLVVIRDAFREIFPPATSEQVYALTEGLRNLTEKLKMSTTGHSSDLIGVFFQIDGAVLDRLVQLLQVVNLVAGHPDVRQRSSLLRCPSSSAL